MGVSEYSTAAELTVGQLAHLAECGWPDDPTGDGAEFLRLVRDSWAESLTWDDDRDRSDVIHELADGLVPIYTWPRWRAFADLAAWQEDLDEWGVTTSDMTERAGVALYVIAERLLYALDSEYRTEDEDN